VGALTYLWFLTDTSSSGPGVRLMAGLSDNRTRENDGRYGCGRPTSDERESKG
jgi:hypothetical protein